MSGEQPDIGKFLQTTRDLVAAGNSPYGDPGSPAAREKLAELDARLEHHRRMGEAAPAPAPWTPERVAAERLATEFPGGDPGKFTIPEAVADHHRAQFDRLDALGGLAFAKACDAVAQDIAGGASAVTIRHGSYNPATGGYASPHAIVEALVADATLAVETIAEPDQRQRMLKLIRADRKLLELFAARGQAMTAYAARRRELGLS